MGCGQWKTLFDFSSSNLDYKAILDDSFGNTLVLSDITPVIKKKKNLIWVRATVD